MFYLLLNNIELLLICNHPNFNDCHARFADLICLYALADNGGIWIDASIILTAPLDNWLFDKNAEFSGFYIDGFTIIKEYHVIKNCFFACNNGCKFVQLWRDEFVKLSTFENVNKYIESYLKMGVNTQKINSLTYLAMHVTAQKIIQKDNIDISNFILRKAENGPYNYLVDANWDIKKLYI